MDNGVDITGSVARPQAAHSASNIATIARNFAVSFLMGCG
jgi:hypothetical protein